MVWKEQFNSNGTGIINVNLQGLAAGVYFVRMKYDDGRADIVEKIIKQ